MANNCYYRMKIQGKKADVYEMYDALRWEGKYENDGIGRVFSCYDYDSEGDNDNFTLYVEGDCAWSIITAMRQDEDCEYSDCKGLCSMTKDLNLKIEAFSSELGFCFEEHLMIDKGRIIIDDVEDLIFCYSEDLNKPEILSEFLNNPRVIESGITIDNYLDFVNDNGDIQIGGFDKWYFI